ncbi:serine hydrolase domain-containing protein [Solimicrobium silvestre]|uniref:serine hydrolase domain-containing protein n=1 Tax=Solimicrobium silvestre TaxID=2099400 RepID=UPI0013FDD191|nr:serine hydrolase domain-containing protein [Solimicrobium silvestre]
MSIQTAAAATTSNFIINEAQAITKSSYAAIFPLLDQFIQQYLKDMNAPGLTLTLVDASGIQRVCTFGVEDSVKRSAIKPNKLFHIGSITKSFLGLCLMQLHDEGKLDLDRPIAEYLPWVRFDSTTRSISTHDLLTHSAALPDGELFPTDPSFRHHATAAPGTFFHYCNMGYDALGLLLETLDQRPLAESFRVRILNPVGMKSTEPIITLDMANRVVNSYMVELNDRPYPRAGRLVAAPPIAVTTASGCIASNAVDMGAYLQMLINRGQVPTGRLVSEAGFKLFSTPHAEADEFGKGAKYGYGITVDTLDGHTRLRHTGGMVSFASALEVDLDAGLGVFVSVNSMQGYRPRPVAEYALRLMRASREGKPLPKIPLQKPSDYVDKASDYEGRFSGADGRILEITSVGDRLYLIHRGTQVTLEPTIGAENSFTVLHPEFAKFAVHFKRDGDKKEGKFAEVGWGNDWYVSADYTGAREFSVPSEWHSYVGHYRNDSDWIGSMHVVLRAGILWLDGVIPLEPTPDHRFFLRDEMDSPEWISFSEMVNGHPMRMKLSGKDLARV